MLQSTLRKALRRVGVAFPQLIRYSGRLGLGRLLTPGHTLEQVVIDDDIVIELDLSVPFYRSLYFHHDLSLTEETILLKRLLEPGDTCVDVGAHIGYVALVAAKYGRRVLAVEPGPTTYRRLQRNLTLNPRLASKVVSLPMALADHAGTMTLLDSERQPNRASLAYRPLDAREVQVEVRTLDQVVAEHRDRVSFLKIDVEGAELDVLRGGEATLRQQRPLVLCELNEDLQAAFGRTCRDIIGFFEALGYVGREVEAPATGHGRLVVQPTRPGPYPPNSYCNALFIPADRVAEIEARLIHDH